jgi:hypothetical protein
MNPKGHVKIELYDEKRGVFFTKEKHNLIVLDANKVIAQILADPSKMNRASKIDKGDTSAEADENGEFEFPLSISHEKVGTFQQSFGADNTNTDVTLSNGHITKLISAKIGDSEVDLNTVSIKDAAAGTIAFATAPQGDLTVNFQYVSNPLNSIIIGTLVVKVGSDVYGIAEAPSDDNKTCVIDYARGIIAFQSKKEDVTVSYDYESKYTLGYIGVADKPTDHPDFKPVTYSDKDKLLTSLENEYLDGRVPVQFPAEISEGKPEIETLLTQPIAEDESSADIKILDGTLEYTLDDSKKLLSITSVIRKSDEHVMDPGDYTLNGTKIAFIEGKVNTDEEFTVNFKFQKDNTYLNYQLNSAPVFSLERVIHTSAADGKQTVFEIENRGLTIGKGDVWLLNPAIGLIQFSEVPKNGVPVNTPGTLTIEYKINAGTVVNFTADFPKGIPGPSLEETTDTFTMSDSATFTLNHPVAVDADQKDLIESVKVNGGDAEFTLHTDKIQIDVPSAKSDDTIEVTYKYTEESHSIYQVAMFDSLDRATSKMFNISGIGPITKDKNTGMRVTWSISF